MASYGKHTPFPTGRLSITVLSHETVLAYTVIVVTAYMVQLTVDENGHELLRDIEYDGYKTTFSRQCRYRESALALTCTYEFPKGLRLPVTSYPRLREGCHKICPLVSAPAGRRSRVSGPGVSLGKERFRHPKLAALGAFLECDLSPSTTHPRKEESQ